jgi:geranylgeranyl reductase family protein
MVSSVPGYFDVLVVGCGPAGGAAAATAARKGLSTAVLDKARFPRDKLCGGLFSGRSRMHFIEAFGTDIDLSLFLVATEIELWARGKHLVTRTGVPPLYLTMRRDLDKAVLDLALQAGAHDLTGHEVVDVAPEAKEVSLRDGTRLRYGVLIGADGVNSRVARALFGQAFDQSTVGFALEVEQPNPASGTPTPVRIDFGAANWGYGWSFPKKLTRTIGVGGLHQRNEDLRGKLAAYIEELGVTGAAAQVKGHFVPVGDFRKSAGRKSILLCGDAAGLVDPLTGEGIAYALKSGQIAADCAVEALAHGRPEAALLLYQSRTAAIRRSIAHARALTTIVYATGLSRAFEALVATPTSTRSSYMELLAGEIEYPALMWRTLRQVPRRALKLGWQAVRPVVEGGKA